MLSRTADHLFWMARYMERAGQARSAWAKPQHSGAHARCGVLGIGVNDAV
jgi:hypothetical protein